MNLMSLRISLSFERQIFTILGEPDGPKCGCFVCCQFFSLLVMFSESDSHNGAVVTRYKG